MARQDEKTQFSGLSASAWAIETQKLLVHNLRKQVQQSEGPYRTYLVQDLTENERILSEMINAPIQDDITISTTTGR